MTEYRLISEYSDYSFLTDKYLIKMFIVLSFAAMMLFFAVIFSVGIAAEKDTKNNCGEKRDNGPVYAFGGGVHSKVMAEKVLNVYLTEDVGGENVRFLRSGLENCGPAFVFLDRDEDTKYVVCEDGTVYLIPKGCD